MQLLLHTQNAPMVDPREILGNVLWLDGSDVDGDFKPGGSFVGETRWIDKSTAKNAHASQTNPARRPSIVSNGLKNLSVVRFDGNDIMDVDAAAFGMLSNVSGATLFGVVKTEITSGQRVFMIATNRAAATRAGLNLFDRFGTGIARTGEGHFGVAGRRLDSDPFQRIDGGAATLGKFEYYASILDYAKSSIALYVHGKLEVSATNFQSTGATSATKSENIRIGADAALDDLRGTFQGEIAEIIAYNRALTPEERAKVEAYLEAKWFSKSE
jgi:hypothetical protein